MRLCFYHDEQAWTGEGRVVAAAAAALRARGHEVIVACIRGEAERRFAAEGLETMAWRARGGRWSAAWRLRALLKRVVTDVVYVHGERAQQVAALAARLAGHGVVVRRVPPFERMHVRTLSRWALRLADTAVVFALEEDQRVAALPSRVRGSVVVPSGVEVLLSRAAEPSVDALEAPTVVTVVCLFDAPHIAELASALRALALLAERHPELRVTLVGPGHEEIRLRLQVLTAAMRIGDLVRYVDAARPASEVREAIAAADIGWVLAAGDEAVWGILDCYAAGIPVIAERNPLTGRFVQEGTGLLLNGLAAPSTAAVLADLFSHPDRRMRWAAAARAAADQWPVETMAWGFERAAAIAHGREG